MPIHNANDSSEIVVTGTPVALRIQTAKQRTPENSSNLAVACGQLLCRGIPTALGDQAKEELKFQEGVDGDCPQQLNQIIRSTMNCYTI